MTRWLVAPAVAGAVMAGVVVGQAVPTHALSTYIIDSAAGCNALLSGIGATGSTSGTECVVTSNWASVGDLLVASGWTLRVQAPGTFTNTGTLVVDTGSTLVLDGPMDNQGSIENFGDFIANAPFTNPGLLIGVTGTVALRADVSNSGIWINLTGASVTIEAGTFTNTAAFNAPGSTTLIEAPVCGAFVGFVTGNPVVDQCSPKVKVEQAVGQTDPTPSGPVAFTVTFAEPVTGFAADDLQLTTTGSLVAHVASVTGGPSVYTVTVAIDSGEGSVSLAVLAGAVADGASNQSAASTSVDNSVQIAVLAPAGPPAAAPELGPTGGSADAAWIALLVMSAGAVLVLAGRLRAPSHMHSR
ncbi:MAG: Ig-like domain-containing protein [Actinomycetota bacterium]|nr:Ig-like domain-containing protein [Actinomycetota bacterium]